MKETLKMGVSGIRGIVGDSLTPENLLLFTQAFGSVIGKGTVVVGRDTRRSGKMIERIVVAGLQSVGCEPLLANVIPTPSALILVDHLKAQGGIMITASHNPVSWNALKLIQSPGRFLNEEGFKKLLERYHRGDFPLVSEAQLKEPRELTSPTEENFKRITHYVNAKKIQKKCFKVAVDCCNGVGALHSVPFLQDHFGCEVVPIFDQPTGIFERNPEPTPAHLKKLSETVIKEKCDIGFAQDPDGDRLSLVDEKGETLVEDLTLALAVEQVLARHKKGPIAINLSTSKSIERVAQKYQCEVQRTKIGESNVSEAMLKMGAVIGGEGSGGVIISDIHPCRDSYTGMAIILELMCDTGKSLSTLWSEIPSYFVLKDKKQLDKKMLCSVLEAIEKRFEAYKISKMDGVHVDFGNSWIHVRPSNTEPIVRIIAEAETAEEAEKLLQELHQVISGAVSI